jgi:glutamate synthase domain-containing protein 3
MKTIDAKHKDFQALNAEVRAAKDADITIQNCCGQRYIAAGLSGRRITIMGTPGNALGAYMDGAEINVRGNAQDATGDTMNAGVINVYGSAGDTTGYAMRGGAIYIRGNSGYRTGIHMKAYKEHQPVIVVGGKAGSFLGEYQAGGIIIVLDLPQVDFLHHKPVPPVLYNREIVGHFTGTGQHGGAIYIRVEELPHSLPPQVELKRTKGAELPQLVPHIEAFCERFDDVNKAEILDSTFCVLTPNSANPYTQRYTHI